MDAVNQTNHLTEEVTRITEEQEKSIDPKTHHSSILVLLDHFLLLSKEHPTPKEKKELESYRCAIVNFVNVAVNNFYLTKERLTRKIHIQYSLSLDLDSDPSPLTCSTLSFDDYTQVLMYQKNRNEFRARLETIYAYLNDLCFVEERDKTEKEKDTEKEGEKMSDCICS